MDRACAGRWLRLRATAASRASGVPIGRILRTLALATVLGGCATLPPGAGFPKPESHALERPGDTLLGSRFEQAALVHDGKSGFRILSVGVDGFLARVQMIDAAERTLDLQYYIFHGDETGRLITDALMRAADRGVRVRVLVDDGGTRAGDEQILGLDPHPGVEVRVFNPFVYRGNARPLRMAEFALNLSRLDYRMHNKLLVVDNALALVGGRNIGNEYFQMDPEGQVADDDVLAAGPVVRELSSTFDEFWRSEFAIPAQALSPRHGKIAALADRRADERARPDGQLDTLQTDGIDYIARIATGEPFASMLDGRLPLVWAQARVLSDSPDKKRVAAGSQVGRLMSEPMADVVSAVATELVMVTPYFIPADEELQIIEDLLARQVRVRLLTNSLESSSAVAAHSGYRHFRSPLLEAGVELYEVRSLLGDARGSGQTAAVSRYGTYSLHAKLFVFDRRRILIGSMNYDQRSKHLNTEVGVIIDSPALALQTAARFDAMARPANSYAVELRPGGLVWRSEVGGQPVEYAREPARSEWQRLKVGILSLLPIAGEL